MSKHEQFAAMCKAEGVSPELLASMKDAAEAVTKMSSGQIQDVMMAALSELWERRVIEGADAGRIGYIMRKAAEKSEKRG